MHANTCWGLLTLAVAFGLAVLGIGPAYAPLTPWLLGAAGLSLLASITCFTWPLWPKNRELSRTRHQMICEALEGLVVDKQCHEWLKRLLTGARPQISNMPHIWNCLQRKGIVEGDFHGPKGLAPGFDQPLRKWLKEHPPEN